MSLQAEFLFWAAVLALTLFFAVLGCLRAGWQLGRRRLEREGAEANDGLGAVEASVFGLMGLLIAFSFNGAATRFDHRRDLIVEEVNAIGTAWLRMGLLQDEAKTEVRELFKQYLDGRIALYRGPDDSESIAKKREHVAAVQEAMWDRLMIAVREDRSLPLATAVLPPVNEMFDIAEARHWVTWQHPPIAIFLMLVLLVLVSAFMAGFGMAKARSPSMLHLAGFAAATALAIYLILDLEFPRLGFVRVDDFDQALIELRESME